MGNCQPCAWEEVEVRSASLDGGRNHCTVRLIPSTSLRRPCSSNCGSVSVSAFGHQPFLHSHLTSNTTFLQERSFSRLNHTSRGVAITSPFQPSPQPPNSGRLAFFASILRMSIHHYLPTDSPPCSRRLNAPSLAVRANPTPKSNPTRLLIRLVPETSVFR